MEVEYLIANLDSDWDAHAVRTMVCCLAADPISGCLSLPSSVTDSLVSQLKNYPNAFAVLAKVGSEPAGMSLCFQSLSSFKARPIVNIHDFVVSPDFRGKGIANGLLTETEKEARNRGACKLTLEVLEGNQLAKNIYSKFGFTGYELDPQNGIAHFWEKSLS